MRLGVLDVGSNTVHLLVVDAHQGGRPLPAFSHKAELRLGEHLDAANRLTDDCAQRLRDFVHESLQIAEDKGVHEMLAFATSAVRDAANGDELLAQIEAETDVAIKVLPGPDEARLTFLAARRWFGWSSGRLLLLDIGGGSLEIAAGLDEEPDAAGLPAARRRAADQGLAARRPAVGRRRAQAAQARAGGDRHHGRQRCCGTDPPNHAVATSKTFRQLARVAGAAPSSEGLYVKRVLKHTDVTGLAERLPQLTAAERCELPGVSQGRAHQLAAGAIVADAAMDLLSLPVLEICPWALREGVILRQLDLLPE